MSAESLRLLSKMIDHSLLHPTMTDRIIAAGCELAKEYQVATACVKPCSVSLAKTILGDTDVGVCAVVAFPHGNSTTRIKVAESLLAIKDGATEIDMVVNPGKVLGGEWEDVAGDIEAVNSAVTASGAILKVIFENDYLDDEHIIRLCEICSSNRVAFVKTSTGYGFVRQHNGMYAYRGATDEHLKLMRRHCGDGIRIKAAGGIRTLDDLLRVRNLGVTRIGATATAAILDEAKARGFPQHGSA